MKTIAGVPETVTLDQVLAAAEVLGFDPKMVRSITLGVGYLEAVVFASTPATLKAHEDLPATHTIFYDLLAKPSADA